jgi:hypothetical protein
MSRVTTTAHSKVRLRPERASASHIEILTRLPLP